MTADAFVEDEKAALAAGMNAHVAKPLEIDELQARRRPASSRKDDHETYREQRAPCKGAVAVVALVGALVLGGLQRSRAPAENLGRAGMPTRGAR